MNVYVVERGTYEDRYVAGVYSSPEKAMAAHPNCEWHKVEGAESWYNGLGLWESAEIEAYEVDPVPDTRSGSD